jgi:hypothetical protein
MAKSITVKRKKRGRPATGTNPLIGVRMPPPTIARLDQWAAENGTTRSETIRRLVEQALSASAARPYSKKTAAAAAAVAEQHIGPLVDPSASSEERQRRKQRLLKGPEEFRDLRGKRKSALKRSAAEACAMMAAIRPKGGILASPATAPSSPPRYVPSAAGVAASGRSYERAEACGTN